MAGQRRLEALAIALAAASLLAIACGGGPPTLSSGDVIEALRDRGVEYTASGEPKTCSANGEELAGEHYEGDGQPFWIFEYGSASELSRQWAVEGPQRPGIAMQRCDGEIVLAFWNENLVLAFDLPSTGNTRDHFQMIANGPTIIAAFQGLASE